MTPDANRTRFRFEKRDRVGYVTIDRPEVLNALDLRTHTEPAEVRDDFAADDGPWLAVIPGAGDRAFSAGGDGPTERFELTEPVPAGVRGYAYGGGFELAPARDVIAAGGLFGLARQIPCRVATGYLLTRWMAR